MLICDYLTHSSIERERRLLDEKRVKWIGRRMEMIIKETKERFQGEMGVECRVNRQAAVLKMPATNLLERIEVLLFREWYLMELLLLCEMMEWEQLFWNKLKAFLDQIGDDRVEEKERLTREWRTNSWKRLNPQKHAAQKRWADLVKDNLNAKYLSEQLNKQWASSISLSELKNKVEEIKCEARVDDSDGIQLVLLNEEIRLRMENEIEDTEFRLKRGSDLGLFDQFWEDDTLFEYRYSRSKWLYLSIYLSTIPLEIYSHALKGNKNINHITFNGFDSDSDINRFQATFYDLPWVTSISRDSRKKFDSSWILFQHIFSRTLEALTCLRRQIDLGIVQEF